MTHVEVFTFSPYQTNSYVCYSRNEAVLVDASASTPEEQQAIIRFIESQELTVKYLLLTHAHVDHIFGCAFFSRYFQLPWHAHAGSKALIRLASAQAAFFGTTIEKPSGKIVPLKEGNSITFGDAVWEVLHTPGHAPGSICFLDRQSGFAMVGDVLFMNSIGRTDLLGGNLPLLMQSIHQKLFPLPDDTIVYSGHGPVTTIGQEKQFNPFLQD